MRRDAQQRRNALIQAAAECFGESGYDVALEDIADRAGVGRGTLYRNFKDRMALILAIFEREVDEIDVSVDPELPLADTIAQLVRGGAPASFLFARLASEMPLQGDNLAAFKALGERLERLVEPAASIARDRGEIRSGIGGHELVLAMRMVNGLLNPAMTVEEMDAEIAAAVSLIMNGLRAG
jgi:AcrR family transcriptional regulator